MWKKKSDQARQLFVSGGWNVSSDSGLKLGHIIFHAETTVDRINADPDAVVRSLKSAISCVSLD